MIITKETLLAELQAGRKRAVPHDAKVLKKHKAQQKSWASQTRAQLTQAMALDDEALCGWVQTVHGYSTRRDVLPSPEGCPISQVVVFDRAIKEVTLEKRKDINLSHDVNRHYLRLIRWDPSLKEEVC